MTVRWRILAFVLASLGSIALLIAVAAVTLQAADRFVRRIDGLHARFEIVAELDGRAADYATQVTRVMLAGDGEASGLQVARVNMVRSLAALAQVTRDEIATLRGLEEVQSELAGIENARRITELYNTIDRAVNRAIVLRREGRLPEAMEVLSREADFRIANELKPLILRELQQEREDIAGQSAEIERVQNLLLTLAGAVALAAIAAVAVLGFLLYRSVMRPLNALTEAAGAIGSGSLDHRVAVRGRDELAALSRTFNTMAEALARQRDGLVAAGERLSGEVEARTRELSSANDQLRSADMRRAQFLADISHQLRTPLTILRGEADVALRGRADPVDQREALLAIQTRAAEMGQLLDDLLGVARAEAEGHQHEPERLALAEIVREAVAEGNALAEPREILIEPSLADGDALVRADARRLRQAIVIGLDNAVKHSPPGARIYVETRRAADRVEIAIADEGPGVAAEDLPRVFERFYRGRGEGELLNEGLGIGLAIARDIVGRHAGTITLANRPEGGAVLNISLPVEGVGAA